MALKLKLKASKLIEALDIVKTVKPRSLTAQQDSSAYLFKVDTNKSADPNKDGKPWCWIYSRGEQQVARAEFQLEELEGEGLFTIPSHHIDMWSMVPEDEITFESSTETKADGNAFIVKGSSSSGMKHEHSSYDPRLIATCDKDFQSAVEGAKDTPAGKYTWLPGILKEALGEANPFLPSADKKDSGGEHLNTVQIFDESNEAWAKGNGHMFCSDRTRAFYFQASDFEGKGLAVHSKFLGKLGEFLSKCSGPVKIYQSTNMSYAANDKDQIFGWVHDVKLHDRWRYVPPSRDKYVLLVPKVTILNAIEATSKVVDEKQDRVKLIYTHNNTAVPGAGHTLQFVANSSSSKFESFPVSAEDKDKETPSLAENFDCFVDLGHFKSLIGDAKGNQVELRVTIIAKDETHPKGGALLRTIDTFDIYGNGKLVSVSDKPEPGATTRETAYTCKVTRCMSSMV